MTADYATPLILRPNSPCWIWVRGVNDQGYPTVWRDGGTRRVHREVWQASNGNLPSTVHLHHICGNKTCYRPGHLVRLSASQHRKLHPKKFEWVNGRCPKNHDPSHYKMQGIQIRCLDCAREYRRSRTKRERLLRK